MTLNVTVIAYNIILLGYYYYIGWFLLHASIPSPHQLTPTTGTI